MKRIASLWTKSEPYQEQGIRWYFDAALDLREVATAKGWDIETLLGVVAALSPGLEWTRNVGNAIEAMKTPRGSQLPYTLATYGRGPLGKAEAIRDGAKPLSVLGGPKTRAFYETLFNPCTYTGVVVDTHMWFLLTGGDPKLTPYRHYDELSKPLVTFAKRVNLLPHQIQATLWLYQKSLGQTKFDYQHKTRTVGA